MQLPIPDDWNGLDTCELSVCWPDSVLWRGILHGLLEMPSQGRFWDFTTGNFLGLRETFKPIYDANFEEFEEVLLSCNDDKFNQLLEVLSGLGGGSGCGCGSGGAGATDEPTDPYDESDGEEIPPDGFDTWDQYLGHKCNAAWAILNNLGSDLNGLGGLVIAITSIPEVAAILITVLLTPVPFDDLLALAGILIFGLVAFSFLSATSALIFDNRFDLVCYLYEADSASQAKVDFMTGLSDLLDSETAWSGVEKSFVLSVVDTMLTDVAMNKLVRNVYVPGASENCDHCGASGPFELVRGTLLSGELDEGEFVVGAGLVNGFYEVHLLTPSDGCVEVEYTYSTAPTYPSGGCGSLGDGNTSGWAIECGTGDNLLGQITPALPPSNFSYCASNLTSRWLRLRSCSTFDLTVVKGATCE